MNNGTRDIDQAGIILSSIYGLFFVVGETGNLIVLGMLICIFVARRRTRRWPHVYVYSVALSVGDCLALASLPFVVGDIALQEWVFGTFLCKFLYMSEMTNKIYSPLMLAVLSLDRYMAVCRSSNTEIRTHRTAVFFVIGVVGVTFCCGLPLLIFATQTYVPSADRTVCHTEFVPKIISHFYVYGIFSVGFCLPVVFMVTFYSFLTFSLRRHTESMRRHTESVEGCVRKQLKRVTATSFLLVVFYVCCFTPYWLGAVVLPHLNITGDAHTAAIVGYTLHMLPYLNSSLNPVFYVFLNKELRRSHAEAVVQIANNGADFWNVLEGSAVAERLQRVRNSVFGLPGRSGATSVTDHSPQREELLYFPTVRRRSSCRQWRDMDTML